MYQVIFNQFVSTTLFSPVIYPSAYKRNKRKKNQQNLFHKRKSESLANNHLLDFVPLSSGGWIPWLTKAFYYLPSQAFLSEKEKNNKFTSVSSYL